MKRLEDVYVDLGLYEAHVEGMRLSNFMLMDDVVIRSFLLIPLYYLFSFSPCKLACKI